MAKKVASLIINSWQATSAASKRNGVAKHQALAYGGSSDSSSAEKKKKACAWRQRSISGSNENRGWRNASVAVMTGDDWCW